LRARGICRPLRRVHVRSSVGPLRAGGQGQAAGAGGARWVASKAPCQASCQGHASGRCQVMVSCPLWAARPATWISSVRMVAPRATACRAEARVPSARVSACAVTASCNQGRVGVENGRGEVGQRPVDQVGEDLLDDGVSAVVGLGLHELERAVDEHRVIPVGGEQLALPLGGGSRVETLDTPHDQCGVGAVGAAGRGWTRTRCSPLRRSRRRRPSNRPVRRRWRWGT
jgi:hypothetical protein